jgi:DNA-binding CsgD family transcriptional regulator
MTTANDTVTDHEVVVRPIVVHQLAEGCTLAMTGHEWDQANVKAARDILATAPGRAVVDHLRRRLDPPTAIDGLDTLTDREREIAAWVATGRSNHEIADALVLSPATVRTHVTHAMTKLNARSRAQLVVLAVRAGLAITP